MNRYATYVEALDAEMRRLVATNATLVGEPTTSPQLYGMLRYHLGWADQSFQPATVAEGKRIRPTMLLLAAEAQGGDWTQALPAAAAIELLHNVTRIHDDIEDGDEMRRGRATLWKLWGVPQAINAGDALFAISYRGMLDLASKGLPLERVMTALGRYTETIVAVTEGQCLDLAFESRPETDEATYLAMIRGKTAALLGLATELGGLIAGASSARLAALREFGEALGMAFQMRDDVLGLWGDPELTGKPAGSDLRQRKKTLPILHGMRLSASLRGALLAHNLDEQSISRALDELTGLGSRRYAEARATEYHTRALDALERSGGSGEAQEALHALAQRLLNRDR